MCGWKGAVGAAALALGTAIGAEAASVGTPEYTQFLPVWLTAGPGLPEQPVPALLNLPPGWQVGDAAVVIARGPDVPPAMRDDFSAAVIDGGAALLELHLRAGQEEELPGLLAEALNTLRIGHGAGLVVAVGYGRIAAATLGVLEAEPGKAGGYTAAAVLEAGASAVAAGRPPAPEEAWPVRAPLLCEVLGTALPGEAGFVEGCARALFTPW
jgi:hypothetical protein